MTVERGINSVRDSSKTIHFENYSLASINYFLPDSFSRLALISVIFFRYVMGKYRWRASYHMKINKDYDVDVFCRLIAVFTDRHSSHVYLDSGEDFAITTVVLMVRAFLRLPLPILPTICVSLADFSMKTNAACCYPNKL